MGLLSKVFNPPRYRFLKKAFPDGRFTLLDVGCGHLSFETVRHYFPHVVYHGVDKRLQGETAQYEKMDRFFNLDLETDTFEEIPDKTYDAIVFSHTIEHLYNGHEVLKRLIPKLKVGGYLYIELPSVTSIFLPAADGTLNFFDDPTHVRLYDLKELVNTLLAADVRVLSLGKARNPWRTAFLTPVGVLYNVYHVARHQRLSAKGLIEASGFADYILGMRHDIPHDERLGSWRETLQRHPLPDPRAITSPPATK